MSNPNKKIKWKTQPHLRCNMIGTNFRNCTKGELRFGPICPPPPPPPECGPPIQQGWDKLLSNTGWMDVGWDPRCDSHMRWSAPIARSTFIAGNYFIASWWAQWICCGKQLLVLCVKIIGSFYTLLCLGGRSLLRVTTVSQMSHVDSGNENYWHIMPLHRTHKNSLLHLPHCKSCPN